jgi:chromosome partitioning protein
LLTSVLEQVTSASVADPGTGAVQTPPVASAAGARARRASLLATVACVGKGGSGKSTTGLNLAVIARRAGFRVGIIDADPQQSSFAWRCVRDRCDIPVCRCDPDHLDDAVAAARRAGIEVLFIDMPPDLRQVPAAARCADLVLIPMRPNLFDLKVTRGLIPLLGSAGARYAVVLNAAPSLRDGIEAPMVRQARDALADIGPRLWKRQITQRSGVAYALVNGAGVIETEPESLAAREYGALWSAVRNALKLEARIHENPQAHAQRCHDDQHRRRG